MATLGREPTDEELAAASDLTADQIAELRGIARAVVSLDQPVGGEPGPPLGERLPPAAATDEEFDVNLRSEALGRALDQLPEAERTVIRLRFGIGDEGPLTLAATGRRIGVTAERVRQIESQALQRLSLARELESLLEVA
jgi:RNA polymerase sigma factor (sigma-70 family)